MKIMFAIAFLFANTSIYAQRITYQDLKYMVNLNLDECGNYLNKKGFNLKSIDSSTMEAYHMVSYH